MKLVNFLSGKKNDRVFVFYSINRLSSQHILNIKKRLNNDFFAKWFSHSIKIHPELLVLCNHFIIISTCQPNISGCSIDSLTREMKMIASELDIDLFNRKKIPYLLSTSSSDRIDNLENIDIYALDYKDFLDKFSSNTKGIFVFNTAITYANDYFLSPLIIWLNQQKQN